MGKVFLAATLAALVLGQADEGAVTSTDLVAPDVSASERDRQAPAREPVREPASTWEEAAPAAPEREAPKTAPMPEATEAVPEEPKPQAPREVTSDEARRHKAVAAFWFILPET